MYVIKLDCIEELDSVQVETVTQQQFSDPLD